jgi:hypothetical protein
MQAEGIFEAKRFGCGEGPVTILKAAYWLWGIEIIDVRFIGWRWFVHVGPFYIFAGRAA